VDSAVDPEQGNPEPESRFPEPDDSCAVQASRARGLWPPLGPLFHYDLVNSTRRGQHTLLRCLTAALLLLTLLVGYTLYIRDFDPFQPFAPPPAMQPNDQANFANWFMVACLVVQMLGLFLLTPMIVSDSIAREKENRTLEFLFVTELTDWEIISGKLFSRLWYLVGILLTALPIIALTQLFGGVDIAQIGFGYSALLSSLFVLGAISMFCSVTAATVMGASVAAYITSVGYGCLSMCCISGVLALSTSWASAGIVAGVNLALGLIIFSASVHELRPRARRIGSRVPIVRSPPRPAVVIPKTAPRVASAAPLATPARSPSFRLRLSPVFENWPLLWKEVYQYGTEWRPKSLKSALLVAVVFPTLFAAFLFLLLYAINPAVREPQSAFEWLGDFSRVIGSVLMVILGSLTGLIVMRHAASSVTKERERDTLISLLVLPVDREEILNAKWLGGFAGWHLILFTMLGVIVFGLVTGGLSIPRAFVLACAIAAPLEFLASLGIWLSVSCRTSFRANLAAVLALLLVAAGPMVVSNILEYESSIYVRYDDRPSNLIMLGGMPPYAWVRCFYADDSLSSGSDRELRAILCGSLAYSITSWVIWRGACARFRRMTR
jgi:ABC-type transport system involved in multi-copper enzyme maturation permease subunit